MFPELPSFSADEAFLFALGRAGGLCDCRTDEDDDGSCDCFQCLSGTKGECLEIGH